MSAKIQQFLYFLIYLAFIFVFTAFIYIFATETHKTMVICAQDIGIRDANHIIEESLSSVAAWPDTAKDCSVRPDHIEAISKTLLLNIQE